MRRQHAACPNALEEHKHFLSVGGSTIGIYISRSDSSQDTRYFHHDHLGSLTLITSPAGSVLERLAYEAFGKRRFTNGADDPNNTLSGALTDRGFTMHEHLDEIALVHMNGRIYDPLIGRFITPDPFIQAPYDLQSHNRYSYVLNNPLSYVDPSGFIFKKLGRGFKKLAKGIGRAFKSMAGIVEKFANAIGGLAKDVIQAVEDNLPAIAAIGLAIVTHGATTALVGSKFAAGAAAGFVGGFVGSGGDIEAAIIGGLTGGALGAVGSSLAGAQVVSAKAAIGCISSAASGGNCATGALSAGISELAGQRLPADPVKQMVGSAVIGGTVSKLGGGSFANGAVTGSFSYMFADQFRGTQDPAGRMLTPHERQALGAHIPTDVLNDARVIDDIPSWVRGDSRAIALGNQIYIRPGQYDIPLLGHELVHVEQFSRGLTYTEYVAEALRAGGVGRYAGNRIEDRGYLMEQLLGGR